MNNLSANTKLVLVKAAQPSGGSAINTDSVKMDEFRGVVFFGSLGTTDPDNFANVAESSDDAAFNDLAGTKVSPDNNGDSFEIDVYKPKGLYVRAEIDRSGTNSATGDIYALLYDPRKKPVASQGSTIKRELHVSPAQGTP